MPSEALERKIASLPDQPGVYLWKGARGEVLYVGKAKRLRQRVRNYFGADAARGPTLQMLLRLIRDLDTIVVPSESQALLLENNLIKEYRPRFNIQLRDDKSYPRIAVTLGEPFPRVLVVRHLDAPGARFFGPYTDVGVLRRTLRIIRRLFTVRSCHYALPDEAPDRPCLDYHIHRCLAPCVGYQSESEYRRMVDDVITFLEGKTVEVRTRLRERMEEASRRLDYERAAEIRDALAWLEQLEQPQAVEFVGGRDTDAIGFARDGDDAVGVVLRVRKGKILAREQRFYENLSDAHDDAILSTFLVGHYVRGEGLASKVALPFAPADLEALRELAPDRQWAGHQPALGGAGRPERAAPAGELQDRVARDPRARGGPRVCSGPGPRAHGGPTQLRVHRHLDQPRARYGGLPGVVRGGAPPQERLPPLQGPGTGGATG
jgi:excinuclease ABC subunit C